MSTGVEVFVTQLARASRRAMRYLHGEHLTREDREDVIATAVAWCWEHRENYSLTTSLETWILNAIKDALRSVTRGNVRNRSTLAELTTADSTLAVAGARSAAVALIAALPMAYRRVLWLDMRGYTRAEMMERRCSKQEIDETRARIRQLRKLLPDPVEYQQAIRTTPINLDDYEQRATPPLGGVGPSADLLLGEWVSQQPGRQVGYLQMFGRLETYASRIRERLNRMSGLDPDFMPTYIPTASRRA